MKMCRRGIGSTSSIFPRLCSTKKMAAAISAPAIWSIPKTRTLTGSMSAPTGSCCTITIRQESISARENTPVFPGKNILISAFCLLASFSGSSTRRVNDGSMMRPYAILMKKSLIFFGFWPSNSLALVAPPGRIAPRRRSNLSWLRPLLHARQARASFRPACYTF